MIDTGVERVAIEEALPGLDEGVTREQLRAAAVARDLDLGILTDEELHWLGDEHEVTTDDIDAPRLGKLPRREADAANEAVLWLLTARGDLEVDGEDVWPVGRHAVVAELRNAPLGVARLTIEIRDEPATAAALYHVDGHIVLVEEVSPIGLHHLVVTTVDRATAWLIATAAPERIAGATAPARTARRERDLRADVDRLGRAAARSIVAVCGRATDRGVEQRATTSYFADGRFHVYGGWVTEAEGNVVLQELGPEDAAGWARWVVTEAIEPAFGGGPD